MPDAIDELQSALNSKTLGKVLDLFRSWDIDGDGTIRKVELRRAVELMGIKAPQQAVDGVRRRARHRTLRIAVCFREKARTVSASCWGVAAAPTPEAPHKNMFVYQ